MNLYDVLSALLVMTEMGVVRDWRCQDALDLLERKRLADDSFPVEWTNVKQADRIETRATFVDWGLLHKKNGQSPGDRGRALRAQGGRTSRVKRR